MNRPAGLRSRFTGTDGRGAARLQASGARVVKCEDRDPDVVNDGVSSMTSDNQSAVFWFGMVAIVGSASLNGRLSQRRPTTRASRYSAIRPAGANGWDARDTPGSGNWVGGSPYPSPPTRQHANAGTTSAHLPGSQQHRLRSLVTGSCGPGSGRADVKAARKCRVRTPQPGACRSAVPGTTLRMTVQRAPEICPFRRVLRPSSARLQC